VRDAGRSTQNRLLTQVLSSTDERFAIASLIAHAERVPGSGLRLTVLLDLSTVRYKRSSNKVGETDPPLTGLDRRGGVRPPPGPTHPILGSRPY